MADLQVEVGKLRSLETILYNEIHEVISRVAGNKMTPAEVNGLLFQISLENLGVFDVEEDY